MALGFTLILQLNSSCVAAENGEKVTVGGTQLGNQGANFTVSSTVGRTICVFPKVTSSENVTGSVVEMIQLTPYEQDVNIGQFMQSDPSKDWSIYVGAKWNYGNCADQ